MYRSRIVDNTLLFSVLTLSIIIFSASFSSSLAFATIDSAPILTATAVAGGDIDLSWTASTFSDDTESVTYDVEQSLTGDFEGEEFIISASNPGLSFTDTGLTDGITYFYRIVPVADDSGRDTLNASNIESAISDSTAPTVSSKTVTDALISDSDASGTFDAVVTFSEAMDTSNTPTLTFTPDVSTTLTSGSGAWSSGDTVYTVTYTVADAGVTETGVSFAVSGAEDVANNAQDEDVTESSTFDIDTENPTVDIGYLDNDLFTSDLYAKSGTIVTLTATSSEPLASSPDITISGANTAGPVTMNLLSPTSYDYDHTVGTGDGTATLSFGTATDIAGNLIVSAPTGGADFYVDNTAPTGTFAIERTDSDPSSSTERTYIRPVNLNTTCDDPALPGPISGSGCDSVDITGTGLDGEISDDFEAISVTRPASLTEFRGLKAADATLRDKAGNTDTLSDDISLDARIVGITVTNDMPYWDVDVTFDGTVENARTDDTITFDFGSPTVTGLVIAGGDSSIFTVTDSYPQISLDADDNPHEPSATLVDSTATPVVDSVLAIVTADGPVITVQPHPTLITLDPILPYPFTGDVFTVTGDLIDALTLTGIAGKLIEFDGSGAVPSLADATTSGFTVTDPLGIVVNNPSLSDYVLRLNIGAEINFPSNPTYVVLSLAEMGTETVNLLVTPAIGDPFTVIGEGQGFNVGVLTITHPAGISGIEITEISSGTAGITTVETLNNDQVKNIEVSFDATTVGSDTVLTFGDSSYTAQGTASSTAQIDLNVFAHFDGDTDYVASPASQPDTELPYVNDQIYSVNPSTSGGFGGNTSITPDVGTGIISVLCAAGNDDDGDALCDDWEGPGNGIPIAGGGVYNLPGSDPNKKNVYVEIDYMAGHDPFPSGAIDDVVAAFANAPVTNVAPATNGIVLHAIKGEQLTHTDNLGVWTDYNTLKTANFGVPGETAEQKAARAQAYHYMVFAHSTGGASGVAELKGNDGIVSLGVGFGETDAAHAGTEGTRKELAGTFMHELGHQLNLNHGGPNKVSFADNGFNCKPNHDSIMSYSRQLPNILGNNWVLDFSNGGILPTAGLRENGGAIPTAGLIAETNGNLVSTDNTVTLGIDPLPYIIWGTPGQAQPYLVQIARISGGSPANIDWNGDGIIQTGSNLNRDINGLGFFGCEASATRSTVAFKNYNEWTDLDYNFRATPSGQFDGIGNDQEDADAKVNSDAIVLTATHNAISPWNADSSIKRKVDTNLPVKVALTDGQGLPITGNVNVKFEMFKAGSTTLVSQGTLNYEVATGHWHTDTKVPKPAGTYYLKIIISNDSLSKVTRDITPSTNPQYVDSGVNYSLKLIATK